MSDLADAVLPLIRNACGPVALERRQRARPADARGSRDPAAGGRVRGSCCRLHGDAEAIASALKVIKRADDPSGIIGDACRALLDLHRKGAARAKVPVGKLVDWMINFQFDDECDFFHLDPVAYAPALGAHGMASYRAKLAVPRVEHNRTHRDSVRISVERPGAFDQVPGMVLEDHPLVFRHVGLFDLVEPAKLFGHHVQQSGASP